MSTKKVTLAIIAALSLGTGACATKQRTGTAVGGATGALVGAGIGSAAGGKKGALIGAAVGAAAGAGGGALAGRYMDKQEEELRRKVETARIERQGDNLMVKFNSQILFDTNKSDIKPQAQKDLADFAGVLKEYDQTNLVVEGHTDSTGPRSWNEQLSEDRAQAVVTFLSGHGVQVTRMTPKGYADERPVATNDTSAGRQANRRVQIQIAPNAELRQQDATTSARTGDGKQRAADTRGRATR